LNEEITTIYNKTTTSPLQDNWDEYACVLGCTKKELRYQEILYKRYYNEMRLMINRYTKDYDEGTSILNNGFLRVFNKIHLYKYPGQLRAWIKKIMVHAVSDYFRHTHSFKNMGIEAINSEQYSTKINETYDYNVLLKAFDILPKATRVVVNLYIIEECSHKEIAQLLKISEGTSKWHLSEGRKLLYNHLNQYR
jgi:RNA polymerase sigma-70 factor, ECF subfamily